MKIFQILKNFFSKKKDSTENIWGKTYCIMFKGKEFIFDSKKDAEKFLRKNGIHMIHWR